MIGKKVKVFWPVDNSWYTGIVQKYDSVSGEHLLKYDDDDTEWVKIGESGSPSTSGLGRSSSPVRGASGSAEQISPIPAGSGESPPNPQGIMSLGNEGVSPSALRFPRPGMGAQMYPAYSGPVAPQGMFPGGPMGYGTPGPYHGYPGQAGSYPGGYGYPPVMVSMPPGGGPPVAGPPVKPKTKRGEDRVSPTPSDVSSTKKKTGPKVWSKEEDQILLSLVKGMRMPMKWSVVAQSMPERTGKQCRERYVNHLNPRLKTADWSPVEDGAIFHLYSTIGSHWAKMAKMIPGRTDNGIKNRFHNLRRQLEREDEHRLRLSKAADFPEEIRLDRLRKFPESLKGKGDELWDMGRGIGVLAAQSVLGGGITRNGGRFGPFRVPENGELCARCGLLVPSLQCGRDLCCKTGWCQSCTRIPPHISGNLLRECLNLRRCDDKEQREIIESWEEFFATEVASGGKAIKSA